jgi:hypothetical protein
MLAVSVSLAQVRWGDQILLGTAFTNTDSTSLLRSTLTTTMTNADTLYSGGLITGTVEGWWKVALYATQTSGTTTLTVQVRLGYKYAPTGKKWDSWNTALSGVSPGSWHTLSKSNGTVSWWEESNIIGYRVIQSGTGVTKIYLSDYNK